MSEYRSIPYSEKLKDPRWQKKRLEVFERDDWTCQYCGEKETTLAVHHLIYRQGIEPWEYVKDDLLTVCEDCHDNERECRNEYENVLLHVLKIEAWSADDIHNLLTEVLKLGKKPCLEKFKIISLHKKGDKNG